MNHIPPIIVWRIDDTPLIDKSYVVTRAGRLGGLQALQRIIFSLVLVAGFAGNEH